MAPLFFRHRAIITGASRGIGLSIARLFAQEGASCLLVARSEPALQAAVAELETLKLPRFAYVVGSVGEEATWRAVGEREKSPTLLISAAGLTHRSLLFSTSSLLAQEILTTNLLGTILGCKYVSKAMIRNKTPGCIINIASIYAHHSGRGSTIYAASKAGVVGFTRALASELGGKNIRVNSISPGYIDTEMLAPVGKEEKEALGRMAPVGRLGTPGEIARAAAFIATNGFVNGVDLRIDGGLSAV
ncbi:NAD(P)-binding protein [Terfezia boudieri ATCC MYA-4762]|uniref:NAD(P)-binding protein n=1 Tax=Terfezia boudieri ATCC MYA-4762 TaxID=1051890 RepID=A0A3N4LD02_9PEZI|nr:NAD(P)-binding protein [Terfezia boudieri ATCC MYA-4762]